MSRSSQVAAGNTLVMVLGCQRNHKINECWHHDTWTVTGCRFTVTSLFFCRLMETGCLKMSGPTMLQWEVSLCTLCPSTRQHGCTCWRKLLKIREVSLFLFADALTPSVLSSSTSKTHADTAVHVWLTPALSCCSCVVFYFLSGSCLQSGRGFSTLKNNKAKSFLVQ